MTALPERRAAVLRVLAEHSGAFEWGQRDCVTLAADVVRAIRGREVVNVCWRTDDEAAAEIERRGGLQAAVTAALGEPYDPSTVAPLDGDIMLMRMRSIEMLAVWAGTSPIGPAASGLHRLDPSHAACAWRV